MKCFEFDQLAAYMDGVLSQEEMKHVEKHLEFCPSCRKVVSALHKEDAFLQEAIQSPVLPAGFDNEVLSMLTPYKQKKKKRNWPYQLLTAATIVLAFGVGAAFYSETQNSKNGNTDIPLAETVETDALYYVKDQGILLEVTDIDASPLKIEIFYRITPEDWVLEDYLKKHNVEHLSQVVDEYERMAPNGKIVDANGFELPFRELSFGGNDRFENSVVIKPSELENLPDTVNVKIDFDELFLQEGSWKLKIPIDMREAKLETKRIPLERDFQFDNFKTTLLEWETSPNAHVLSFHSEYTDEEKQRLVEILRTREENTELHSVIMPELKLVTKDGGREMLVDGVSSHSYMGQSFTTEFEFANRLKGMKEIENLKGNENFVLVLEGFRLHEPEYTQFELTNQSENVQMNGWIIESVTTEPVMEHSKMVTITGSTIIENAEEFTVELKEENQRFNTEMITIPVNEDGTFEFQAQMPNSSEIYIIDIQSLIKWIPFEIEVPLDK